MYHSKRVLQQGAIVLGDAHYSPTRRVELLAFFYAIEKGEVACTQLVLMGDTADALFGYIPYTQVKNKEFISLLYSIAQKIEVIYLEGNHDFQLQNIFHSLENFHIYPLAQQPLVCDFQGKKVALAHGDFDGNWSYKLYTAVIRNSYVLRVLKVIDEYKNHTIIKKIENYLGKKEDCNTFEGFEAFIEKRFENLAGVDYFIEGHFHQNKRVCMKNFIYINLAAFACNQRYFSVELSQDNQLSLEVQHFKVGEKDG